MATEKRLIDANALMKGIKFDHDCVMQDPEVSNQMKWRESVCYQRSMRAIEKAPIIDAVEVVHGRWEQVQRWATKAKYRCSVCGREIMSATKVNIEKYPYCHCGAKMDLE